MQSFKYDDETLVASQELQRERMEWERQRDYEIKALAEMRQALADSWRALETEQRTLRSRAASTPTSRRQDEISNTSSPTNEAIEISSFNIDSPQLMTTPQPQATEESVLGSIAPRKHDNAELFHRLREETRKQQT
jgi:hypothetical protein